MDSNSTPEATGTTNSSKNPFVALAILVALLIVVSGFTLSTRGNADYICTQVIEDTGMCSNGSWSDWQTVEQTGSTGTQQRVYTGTRTLRHTVTYSNVRSACNQGFTGKVVGSSGGASGFHGTGSVVSESEVCQVQEQRSVSFNESGGVIEAGGVTSDITYSGDIVKDTTEITSANELANFMADLEAGRLAARREQIASNITAQPALVASGQTTQISWDTTEMVACRVTSDKTNDVWGADSILTPDLGSIAGTEESSPITGVTTFTLNCSDFEGNPHQEQATVRIAPQWQEI